MNNYKGKLFTYPALDLHGETRATIVAPLNEFINDNIKLGNKNVAIIHGIGEGIIKKETHILLKKDKRVASFYIDIYNPGCTIVQLTLDK